MADDDGDDDEDDDDNDDDDDCLIRYCSLVFCWQATRAFASTHG